MSRYETIRATPPNIDELEKMARDRTSWRVRIFAVDELRKWNCKRSRDVLLRLAESDAITEVRIQAMRALEVFGEAVGYTGSNAPDMKAYSHRANKVFKRICAADAGIEASKAVELLRDYDPELYDIMDYYKGDQLEEWARQVCSDIRKR